MDVELSVSGKEKNLTFKHVFVNRSLVYQMSTSIDVRSNLRSLGSKKCFLQMVIALRGPWT